jgi:hypothetical protein
VRNISACNVLQPAYANPKVTKPFTTKSKNNLI